jgi:hypothetical protein
MQIVELGEYISLIDFIVKKNYLQNLNYFYLSKNNSEID